eukprot:gene18010-21492_t
MPQLLPKQPVLLLHGLFGFKNLGPLIYYRNIANPLAALGVKVRATRVHPTDSIANRARQVHTQMQEVLKEFDTDTVHIIAHSMGGLDARYLIDKLDDSNSVLSLTTLATPHRGSTIADWTINNLTQKLGIEKMLNSVGVPLLALDQLSPTYLKEEFNQVIKDKPGVEYVSYGPYKESMGILSPFSFFHSIMTEREGLNDGLVSLTSSEWGSKFHKIEDCDHIDIINLSHYYESMPIYLRIMTSLAELEAKRSVEQDLKLITK